MPPVHFARTYNHTWPSRAMSEYPAGFKGTVKQEVADAAAAGGYLFGVQGERQAIDELPRNVPKLKKIARDEGVELGDAKSLEDITSAIVTARAVRSAPPSGTSATPGAPAAPITSADISVDALPPGEVSE